jgi:hypothetical protein
MAGWVGEFCHEFEGIEVLGKEPIFSPIPQILLTFSFSWVLGLVPKP